MGKYTLLLLVGKNHLRSDKVVTFIASLVYNIYLKVGGITGGHVQAICTW